MSFGRRLATYGSLLVIIAVGFCALIAYFSRLETLKVAAGSELLAIVNSAACAIDGDQHDRVHRNAQGEIEPRSDFEVLHKYLSQVEMRNGLHGHGSPIYTFRKADDFNASKELEFVVMTHREQDGDFIVGSRYPVLPHLLRAFEGTPEVTKIYEDEEGLWLSAAAPIFNRSGQVVGVVQADRPVNYFKSEAKHSAMWILSTAAVSVLAAWLMTRRYASSMVRTVESLADATRRVAAGQLGARVEVHGQDELAELSASFNHMTAQLEQAGERDRQQREEMACAHAETADAKSKLEKLYAELERSYAELSRLAIEAQSANVVKTQFLSVMSHELRTPLNGVIGLASLLEQSGLDADSTDSAKTIRKSGEQLLEIIENVLMYTELDRGTLAVGSLEFDVALVVDEILGRVHEDASLKGLVLESDCDSVRGVMLKGDQVRVQRALGCLVSNAVKFTSQGRIRVSVFLEEQGEPGSVQAGQPMLRIRVADTGVGVPASKREDLFKPFTQADSSTTREFGGIGIGLVLVKLLAGSLGGEVRYIAHESQPGSTFELTVKIEKVCLKESTVSRTQRSFLTSQNILPSNETNENAIRSGLNPKMTDGSRKDY